MPYQDTNQETIDRWISEGWEWGQPISHHQFEEAAKGNWDIVLTPTKKVPHEWIGDVAGEKVLGLAAGGGQQMPILAALGAECTVLDYSKKQIESDQYVAEREGHAIAALRADMTQPLPFADESFDLIIHPVSNCYVKEVIPIFAECFRILKKGGALLSGLDTGINYLCDQAEERIINSLPFDPLANPDQLKQPQEDDSGIQFSHTLEEQIGGQLKAGFRLTDLYEDTNGEGRLHELHIPSFIGTRAVKD